MYTRNCLKIPSNNISETGQHQPNQVVTADSKQMACMKPHMSHERQVYTYLDIFMHNTWTVHSRSTRIFASSQIMPPLAGGTHLPSRPSPQRIVNLSLDQPCPVIYSYSTKRGISAQATHMYPFLPLHLTRQRPVRIPRRS